MSVIYLYNNSETDDNYIYSKLKIIKLNLCSFEYSEIKAKMYLLVMKDKSVMLGKKFVSIKAVMNPADRYYKGTFV